VTSQHFSPERCDQSIIHSALTKTEPVILKGLEVESVISTSIHAELLEDSFRFVEILFFSEKIEMGFPPLPGIVVNFFAQEIF
jgi:hypothetical protein